MTKTEIIEEIARHRLVETMVQKIAHQSMSDNADLSDLSQMVYLILLEYDEDKLQDLWEHQQINFFLARIIVNQYRSSLSPFHITYRKFRSMTDENISRVCNDPCIPIIDKFGSKKELQHED